MGDGQERLQGLGGRWHGMLYSLGFADGAFRAVAIQSQISLVKVLRVREILSFLSRD
jgi:hypothetical protein